MNIEVRPLRTAVETALAKNFATAKGSLPGVPTVAALRENAFESFETEGLPHRRIEEWKYTDLRALMREAKPLARLPDSDAKKARAGAKFNPGRGAPGHDRRWQLRAGVVRPRTARKLG